MRKIEDYKAMDGFFDLRKFNLPKKVFLSLWNVQEILESQSKNYPYLKKFDKFQLQKLQNLSANYQGILFSYTPLKDVAPMSSGLCPKIV
jgi:hypothetical protein